MSKKLSKKLKEGTKVKFLLDKMEEEGTIEITTPITEILTDGFGKQLLFHVKFADENGEPCRCWKMRDEFEIAKTA